MKASIILRPVQDNILYIYNMFRKAARARRPPFLHGNEVLLPGRSKLIIMRSGYNVSRWREIYFWNIIGKNKRKGYNVDILYTCVYAFWKCKLLYAICVLQCTMCVCYRRHKIFKEGGVQICYVCTIFRACNRRVVLAGRSLQNLNFGIRA